MHGFVKTLPLGLVLPVAIAVASVKPEDAASNVAAWAKFLGFENTPSWLSNPAADHRVIVGSLILAVLYAFAVWGIPAVRRHLTSACGQVPLHEAARLAYEAAEKAGVLHLTTSSTASPETKLAHFKLLFMVDDETELFGIKPPSTISRPIPKTDFHHLHPADGAVSEIHHLFPNDGGAAYINVTVRRKDLRRVINGYIAEARQLKWS